MLSIMNPENPGIIKMNYPSDISTVGTTGQPRTSSLCHVVPDFPYASPKRFVGTQGALFMLSRFKISPDIWNIGFRILLIFILASLIISNINISVAQDWSHGGPYGAWVTAITYDSNDTTKLYCGTNYRGIWKSENGGRLWTEINEGIPESGGVGEGVYDKIWFIRLNPQNSDSIWICSGNNLLISDNGGISWEIIEDVFPENTDFVDLQFNPDDNQIIYVGIVSGLYVSSNNGNDWNLETALPNGDHVIVSKIVFNPNDSDHIYACVTWWYNNVWESLDGGESWNEYYPQWVNNLVINPENTNQMFARTYSMFEENVLTYTSDGGISWITYPDFPREYWRQVKSLYQDNHGNLYVMDNAQIRKSSDFGESWSEIASDISGYRGNYNTTLEFASNPENENSIYMGNNLGLFYSNDGGYSLQNRERGIDNTIINYIAPHPTNPSIVYAAGNNGVWKSTNGGHRWDRISAEHVNAIVIDPLYPDTLYWGGENLRRSFDGGESFESIRVNDGNSVTALAIHPTNTNIVYYAKYIGFYRSDDNGDSWSRLNPDLNNYTPIMSIYAGVNDPDDIYLGQEGLIYSENRGVTWQRLYNSDIIASFSIDQEGERFCAVIDRRFHLSENGGRTFTDISDSIDVRRHWNIVFDPDDSQIIYVATEQGVFSTENDGESWELMEGPYDSHTYRIAFSSNNRSMYIGTRGYGIWRYGEDINSINGDRISNSTHINYNLLHAFPNPFNSNLAVNVTLKNSDNVTVSIYNNLGQLVTNLYNGSLSSGQHKFNWNTNQTNLSAISSSMYFVNLNTSINSNTIKVVNIK